MIQTYKITNINEETNITREYVITKLKEINGDYELTDDNLITYRGIYDLEQIHDDSLDDVLINNDIRFTVVAQCSDCGEFMNENNLIYVNDGDGGIYVCDDCINDSDKYFYCEHCNEWYDYYSVERYITHDGREICSYCYNDYYDMCYGCDEIYNRDELYYDDGDDCSYCRDCYEENNPQGLLYSYHSYNDWRPTALPNETPQFYIGHELEIDYGSDMRDAVNSINTMANGICMHDGSLSSKGIEFISQPLSYKYMLSLEENYRKLFDHLINLGYKSHNTTDCGLHFHVTRPEDTTIIDRIILFMETYKEEIITLSRRQGCELNRWSRFLSDKRKDIINNEKVIKSLDYIINNKETYDRYMALNLTNSKTIEFRFFKGTLKYETFMADFEFVNNLVELASDLTLPIEELTWTKVVSKGQFLPQYIEEHNLQSTRPIIDYSKELIVEFNKEKSELKDKIDNIITELLKNIANKARQKSNTAQKLKNTTANIYKWNEILSQLHQTLYNLENLQVFDYYKLDMIKSDIKYTEERMSR